MYLCSTCTVHYTGRLLDGTVFDSSVSRGTPFKFKIGVNQVIRGWDEGVATMKRGEKAFLVCPPDYAYGASGSPPKIPPNATLRFEVELIDFKPAPKEIWQMNSTERLVEAELRKDAGNKEFTGGNLFTALQEYEQGWTYVERLVEEDVEEEQLPRLKAVKSTLMSNAAAVCLKSQEYRRVIDFATKALNVDPKLVKALYRRGSAYLNLGEHKKSHKDLSEALELAPNDTSIKKELARLLEAKAKETERKRKAFGGIFQRKDFNPLHVPGARRDEPSENESFTDDEFDEEDSGEEQEAASVDEVNVDNEAKMAEDGEVPKSAEPEGESKESEKESEVQKHVDKNTHMQVEAESKEVEAPNVPAV